MDNTKTVDYNDSPNKLVGPKLQQTRPNGITIKRR